MTNNDILSQLKPERIETGFYASLIINTKGRKLPMYLMDFFRQMFQDSIGLFDVRTIFEQTQNKEYWRQHLDERETIDDKDTLFQVVCTINMDNLTEEEFEKYIDMYVDEDLLPFLIGCDFDLVHTLFVYQPPFRYNKLASRGEHSVIIHSKNLSHSLYGVLKNVFELDDFKIEEADGYFDMIGQYRIDNCITKDNLPKLETLMRSLNLKYDIE